MNENFDGMTAKEYAEFKVTKSRVKTLMQTPFFGQLLCNLELEERNEVLTMGTNGNKLYYAVDFVNSLEQNELNFVNVHEVLHVALGHIWRKGTRNHEIWNIACDYAINAIIIETIEKDAKASAILKTPSIVLYEPKYADMSAEEIYEDLYNDQNKQSGGGSGNGNRGKLSELARKMLDNHSSWEEASVQEDASDKIREWEGKLVQASSSTNADKMATGLTRLLNKLTNPTKDWREEISDFCQPEVSDYSFCPPDKRYGDYDFFLPDINDTVDAARDVLIVMDTSASISQAEETAFYSETYGAINQFGDRLTGWVMFFDGEPYDPIRFEDANELIAIAPKGGGGTNFKKVFKKIRELHGREFNFSGIMFCTDGYDTFPSENPIPEIPLLWVLTSDVKPPFGRTTKITVKAY